MSFYHNKRGASQPTLLWLTKLLHVFSAHFQVNAFELWMTANASHTSFQESHNDLRHQAKPRGRWQVPWLEATPCTHASAHDAHTKRPGNDSRNPTRSRWFWRQSLSRRAEHSRIPLQLCLLIRTQTARHLSRRVMIESSSLMARSYASSSLDLHVGVSRIPLRIRQFKTGSLAS